LAQEAITHVIQDAITRTSNFLDENDYGSYYIDFEVSQQLLQPLKDKFEAVKALSN